MSDVLNYIDHGDPQIRGATAILCGTIVNSILIKSRFDVEKWLINVRSSTGNNLFYGYLFVFSCKIAMFSCSTLFFFFF